MTNLFGGGDAPQYVGAAGQAVSTKSGAGLFGVFPGTPQYESGTPPVATPPPAPTAPSTPTGSTAVPPVGTSTSPPSLELTVKVPGLLSLQGAVSLPPWLLDCAPMLLPLVIHFLRQRLADELGPPVKGGGDVAPEPQPGDPSCESSRAPAYARPETEARVWDRE